MHLAVYGHSFGMAARVRCTFCTYASGGPDFIYCSTTAKVKLKQFQLTNNHIPKFQITKFDLIFIYLHAKVTEQIIKVL